LALRDSLRSGYIDRLRRRVRDDAAAAARVTESYRILLDTIGLAFDERRVREGDRIQRASVWLAAGFGVLGVSGIAQATMPVPTFSWPWAWGVKILLWVVSVIVLLGVWGLITSLRSVGQIATQEFEKHYDDVRKFLANASTDYLDRFRPEQPGSPKDWMGLDKELCEKFRKAWEAPSNYLGEAARNDAVKGDARADPYNAQPLRRRVEKWSLETLLLTERPRDFSLYPLPYLTCLYRVCTAEQLKSWVAVPELPNAYSAVSDAELREVLPNNNIYKWFRREEGKLRQMTPQQIYGRLQACEHFPQGDSSGQDVES
jgi:hypothetical protein